MRPVESLAGRRAERDALDRWAAEAWEGRFRVVIVHGAAGVGKTALIDASLSSWLAAGATVRAATCQHGIAVPYLPLLSALGAGATASLPITSADDVAVAPRTPELILSLVDELLRPAAAGPTVLCLDDVHWADAATLDVLGHLAAAAGRRAMVEPLSLLILLGSRPVPRGTPAERTLARIRRDRAHRDLAVEGLAEPALHRLLGDLLGARPSARLVADVLEATDGNPLFVQELVRHLADREAIERDGATVTVSSDLGPVPGELDDVLDARIARLDERSRELLTVAAHLDEDESIDDLARLVGLADGELDASLDELETAGLLLERPDGTFVLPHDGLRQVLAHRVPLRAARALHLRIAEHLLERGAIGDADVLRIAHHLRRAGPKAPPALLRLHAEQAARTSLALGAWTKAARYAELALEAADDESPSTWRAEMHVVAAQAHFRNHDPHATAAHADRAVELARDIGDLELQGRALLIAHRSQLTLGDHVTADLGQHRALREFVDLAGDEVPAVRARCWQLLAEVAVTAGATEEALDAAARGEELATELADDVLAAEVHFARGLAHFGGLRPEDAADAFERSAALARAGGDEWVLAWPLGRLALTRLVAGDLDAAESALADAVVLDRRTHHWAEEGLARAGQAALSLVRNHAAGTEEAAADALELGERSEYPFVSSFAWPVLAWTRAIRLDRLGALEVVDRWRGSGVRGADRFRLLVDALTLPSEELRSGADPGRLHRPTGWRPHGFAAGGLAIDVEVGVRLGDEALVVEALAHLDELAGRGVRHLLPTGASVDRLRGMAHVGLGDAAEGRRLLEGAARSLREAGARTEALHADVERCLALAELGDPMLQEVALDLAHQLDHASMLALHQRLREQLPVDIARDVRVRRTVVVWDMVGSTQHLVAVGDGAYVELVHELNALIHRRLSEHRGIAFKYTGDGVFAWFHRADEAVRCALAVCRDLAQRQRRSAGDPLRLRAGIAEGRPVADAGDLFGVAVVTAARLCDLAEDGGVLCTADTLAHLEAPLPTGEVRAVSLKGLGGPVEVVELAVP